MNAIKRAFAGLIVAATALITVAPAQAAPLQVAPVLTNSEATVLNARHRHYRHHNRYRHHKRYRRSNNGAAIAGALIGGAIIGGVIANSNRRYYEPRRVYQPPRRVYSRGYSNAHVRYCFNRYRSYRAYDNTFQPYHGGRRQCRSGY